MRVKIEDAARILERPPQFIRIGLQRELFPFGFATRGEWCRKYTYFINPAQFANYCGMSIQELERRLSR